MHQYKNILFAAIVVVVAIALLIVAANNSKTSEMAVMTIEETTPELIIESETPKTDFTKAVDAEQVYNDHLDVLARAESLEVAKQEKVRELTEAQMIVTEELNQLKLGNPELVKKYFGESQKFTPEIVADRTASAKLHFLVSPEHTHELHAHVCTLDYVKIAKDYAATNDSDVARGILEGEYDICYNLKIEVDDNGVIITEALKEAITGGWYSSDLETSQCIL